MPERSYRILLWSLALIGLSLDQATKYGVFAWLHGVDGNVHTIFQDRESKGFHLVAQFESDAAGRPVPHVNHGALFGFLRNHKTGANIGFAVISLFAAVAILVWSSQKHT